MSEKKKLVRILLVFAVCFAAGIGAGVIAALIKDGLDLRGMLDAHAPVLLIATAVLMVSLVMIVLGYCYARKRQLRNMIAALDPDDDDAIDDIEKQMNAPLSTSSAAMVVLMGLFPIAAALGMRDSVSKTLFGIAFPIVCVAFMAGLLGIFFVQKQVVDLEKQLNPEKRGSLLDLTFQKKWEASCDEAELSQLHQAGYKAFRAGAYACPLAWIVSIFAMFALDTGVLPCVLVCVVWLVMQLTYSKEVSRA